MSFRHSVYIVASPRARVGKTLLSRVLIDYHKHEGREVRAFDLNRGDATLAHFAPEDASPADIGTVPGQMALFDALVSEEGGAKIVDVGVDVLQSFFDVADRIGLAEETRKRDIAEVILFINTPDKTSADVYRNLRKRFRNVALTPVHNEMLMPMHYRDRFPDMDLGRVNLRFPVLAPGLRKYIERPPFSFADERLANAKQIPLEAHIELQRWLRKSYLELRELDLRVLLGELQSALRP